MPKLVILGEVALDYVAESWRLGGASYAARAAAASGANVVLAGPLLSDVPGSEIARLDRLGITITNRTDGASTRYVMLGTGPGEARSTIRVPGTAQAAIVSETADAWLILATPGVGLGDLLAAAKHAGGVVALDGHSDEMRDPRSRGVLREVDVLLLNLADAVALGDGDALASPMTLGRTDKITVIKHGRGGLTVLSDQARLNVGAYDVAMRDKVGAGDTLIGAALARLVSGDSLERAFTYGAAAAAHHIESGTVPEPGYVEDMLTRERTYVGPERFDQLIYVAAPFFTTSERLPLDRLVRGLEAAGLRVASPSRDVGILRADATPEQTQATFHADIAALDESAAVVAILDQDDPGTAWEVGYAFAKGIPIIGIRTDVRAAPNNMLTQSVQIARGMDELLRLLFRVLAR